jgi:hypothetical protein
MEPGAVPALRRRQCGLAVGKCVEPGQPRNSARKAAAAHLLERHLVLEGLHVAQASGGPDAERALMGFAGRNQLAAIHQPGDQGVLYVKEDVGGLPVLGISIARDGGHRDLSSTRNDQAPPASACVCVTARYPVRSYVP